MAAKQLEFDEAARHSLLRGVEKLAKALIAVAAVSTDIVEINVRDPETVIR